MRADALSLSAMAPMVVVLISLCGSSLPPPHYFVPVNPTEPATTYVPRNTTWRLLSQPDGGNALHIAIFTGTPSCYTVDGIDVTETPDVVTLIAREQDKVFPPSPPTACILVGVEVNVDVTLNAPLGNRRLEGCHGSDLPHGETPAGTDCRATLR